MSHRQNKYLINRLRGEPAPLLPILHAFQDRDGYLSAEVLHDIADMLHIPWMELVGAVTFYHHFTFAPPGQSRPCICTGPVCRFHGGHELLAQMADQGAVSMPCAGRCDQPVPVLQRHTVFTGRHPDKLTTLPSPRPVPNPGGFEECLFRDIRKPGRATLSGYFATGGYQALEDAVGMTPAQIIGLIMDSELTGRGGAGFPTGRKWQMVAAAPAVSKTIICNADEGEPGCFKDRALLDYDPHAVIEGMIIAARATGATVGFIYLRYEYPETAELLENAIAEAKDAGLLGDSILNTRQPFHLYVRRGAGAYICGEETALIASLEGKRPMPAHRPPYPVTSGFEGRPTVVNNVETFACVPPILRFGAEWFKELGLNGRAGTKLISLSGDIRRPGNYEVPSGLPLTTLLYDWASGPEPGRTVQAVTMAGVSGGFLAGADLAVPLDDAGVRAKGSYLGAGGIIVYDDRRDMVEVAHSILEFFAHESCGKCIPCRVGTIRLTERLDRLAPRMNEVNWLVEVNEICDLMQETSGCGLGQSAPLAVESLLRYFPEQVRRHLGIVVPELARPGSRNGTPPDKRPVPDIAPAYK